jgi:hypothetical protein
MGAKERLLLALCGISLAAGAANAQVIVHADPRRPLLWSIRDHLCILVGCGSLDITDGTGGGIFGWADTGRSRLGLALCGFPGDGFLGAGATSGSPDIGASA